LNVGHWLRKKPASISHFVKFRGVNKIVNQKQRTIASLTE